MNETIVLHEHPRAPEIYWRVTFRMEPEPTPSLSEPITLREDLYLVTIEFVWGDKRFAYKIPIAEPESDAEIQEYITSLREWASDVCLLLDHPPGV